MALVWTRSRALVAGAVGLVLVGGGAAFVATRDAAEPTSAASAPVPSPASSATPTPKPTDPLTGGKVSDHPVIAVKVENIAAARPQVGLSAADIVFVEEVEGAQTRLIAVYHSRFPTAVEPVRSARNTDVQLLGMFGRPGLVYSGANARVQRNLDRSTIVPIYRATRDPARLAPHNVRVNLAEVAKTERTGKAQPIGWTFAVTDDRIEAAKKAPTVQAEVGNDTFSFSYSKDRYLVRWNGETYRDGRDQTLTRTDNVVVMSVRNRADGNRDVAGSASVQSETVGRGAVAVYRDGRMITGAWSREKATSPMRLTDGDGDPIPLKPGQTWVALRG